MLVLAIKTGVFNASHYCNNIILVMLESHLAFYRPEN